MGNKSFFSSFGNCTSFVVGRVPFLFIGHSMAFGRGVGFFSSFLWFIPFVLDEHM